MQVGTLSSSHPSFGVSVFFLYWATGAEKNSGARAPRASRFFQLFLSCAAHSLYTEWRESTPHTQTLLPNTRLARPACYTMATFSGFCLRAFVASRLESAVKQVGGSGGDRDGGGGGRGLGGRRCRDVCPCLCVGGVARRGSGRAAGRNRTATAAAGTGAVAVTQGWWRPPRAGGMQPARRGDRWARPLRAALFGLARVSGVGMGMGTFHLSGLPR